MPSYNSIANDSSSRVWIRAVFFELEPSVIDEIHIGTYWQLFRIE
jgi:tubulin alpha